MYSSARWPVCFFLSSSFISCNAPRNKGKQSKTEDTTFIPPAKSGLNPPVLWFCVAKSKVIWDACISSVFIMRPVYHYFTQGCGACLHLIPRLLNSQRAVYSGIQKKASWWHPRAVADFFSRPQRNYLNCSSSIIGILLDKSRS